MDVKKFSEYVNTYRDSLYIMALAILKNEADAEDAVSNAVLKAYENRKQLKVPHKFKAWMLTITKNEALKIKRKQLILPGNEAVESMIKPVHEHYDELWDVLQQIKEEYRLVIILFYYEDLPLKTISHILAIPIGTVKSRLSRGKADLKNIMEGGNSNG